MTALVVISAGLMVTACNQSKPEQPPAASAPAPAADALKAAQPAPAAAPAVDPAVEAKQYFTQTCIVCHGPDGKGDGPGAAALNPKPQNYTDAKWQASVKDDELRKAILQGGLAVGRSPIMPAHPDLKNKPQVVDELIKIIRGFKAQ